MDLTLSRREAGVRLRAMPRQVRPQDRSQDPRAEAAHLRQAAEVPPLRQGLPRPLLVQGAQ